jgi:hypothetical protein
VPAEGAVGFILRAQHTLGGWRYNPMEAGDTCVFGWAIFALRSANIAGISIPKMTLRGANKYLDDAASDPQKTTYGYQPGGGATAVMTAEALVCRQLLGWKRDNPALVRGVETVFQQLQADETRNIYYWYYATQLLHNMRDEHWPQWNQKVREALIASQIKGNGCDRGSWDPEAPSSDVWGSKAGRLYTTSLSLLTLEVYYRYLPLYRDQGGAIENQPGAPAPAEGDDAGKPKDDATREKPKGPEDGADSMGC